MKVFDLGALEHVAAFLDVSGKAAARQRARALQQRTPEADLAVIEGDLRRVANDLQGAWERVRRENHARETSIKWLGEINAYHDTHGVIRDDVQDSAAAKAHADAHAQEIKLDTGAEKGL